MGRSSPISSNLRQFLPVPYHLGHAPNKKFKTQHYPGFIFAYGCKNPEVIVIYSGFRYLEGHFHTSFKFLDDHIWKSEL